MFYFSLRMVGGLFSPPFYPAEVVEQMYAVGIGSLWLITLTGIFAGEGFAMAFSLELADFGAKDYLGRIMSISIVRELGPVLTGLMVAARVASGITAELGSMQSSNQIDAMVAFGIDPFRRVVVPRLVALIVMVPVLTIICDFIAIVGGWVIAEFVAHVSSTLYWASVKDRLVFGNLLMGIVKPIAFSFVIAIIACYKGFTAEGGTKGVGRATTQSVVLTSVSILVVNFLLTKTLGTLLKGFM